MTLIFYPLGYLSLQDEKGRSMRRRDAPAALFGALLLSAPFIAFPDAVFFGSGGFLASVVALFSTLAGFYVAALVAAATLSHGADLDSVIQVGKIFRDEDEGQRPLTRRQFVCALFGYLAFLAFVLSIVLNLIVPLSQSKALISLGASKIYAESAWTVVDVLGPVAKVLISIPISHLFVVTSYGLYYLIKRLYEKRPALVQTAPPANDRAA